MLRYSACKSGPVCFFLAQNNKTETKTNPDISSNQKKQDQDQKIKTMNFFSLWTSLGLNWILASSDQVFNQVGDRI